MPGAYPRQGRRDPGSLYARHHFHGSTAHPLKCRDQCGKLGTRELVVGGMGQYGRAPGAAYPGDNFLQRRPIGPAVGGLAHGQVFFEGLAHIRNPAAVHQVSGKMRPARGP